MSGASGTPPSGVITRGRELGIADAVAVAVDGFDLLGLAVMMLGAGVKAVFVSVPVGLMVSGALVGITVGVDSGEVSLTTGGGLNAGVFDVVIARGGLALGEKLGV